MNIKKKLIIVIILFPFYLTQCMMPALVKSEMGKDTNLIVVKKINTSFGKQTFLTEAVVYDNIKAKEVWNSAAKLGSNEALTRIAATNILEQKYSRITIDIDILKKASKLGSILAEVTLASLYENGIGVKKDKSKAILYHLMNQMECSISIITDFEIRVGITSAFHQCSQTY